MGLFEQVTFQRPDAPPPERPRLGAAAVAGRFAIIGAVLLGSAASFAYAGGWLTPDRLTPAKLVSGLEATGVHPGFRRNHAKGLCATGTFESTGAAASLSKATILAAGRTPLVARFSFAGGLPAVPDAPGLVRAFALRLQPANGQEWRTGMINIPVFPFATARDFFDQGQAFRPDPATGKPDPARVGAFVASHPDFAAAGALVGGRAISSGFADTTYNGLNAFRFVAADGKATLVRWAAVPVDPVVPAPAGAASPSDPNALYEALIARAAREPVRWRLVVTLADEGDPVRPDKAWPAGRRTVEAGTIAIERLESEDGGPCQNVTFDPLVLPPGIESSGDEILSTRSATYSRSFRLREGEQDEKAPSAVTPALVAKGAKS